MSQRSSGNVNDELAADPPGRESIALAPGVDVPRVALGIEFVRSSGPGGQNVNKRSTKCRVRIRVGALHLEPGPAARLRALAGDMLSSADEIVVMTDEYRSQRMNLDECVAKLRAMIARALVEPRVRRATRPSRASKQRRLDAKRIRARTKQNRRGSNDD